MVNGILSSTKAEYDALVSLLCGIIDHYISVLYQYAHLIRVITATSTTTR